jgi:hypothetical protein
MQKRGYPTVDTPFLLIFSLMAYDEPTLALVQVEVRVLVLVRHLVWEQVLALRLKVQSALPIYD